MAKGSKPLTELLIDLAHDEDLVARFREDPSAVLAERGLLADRQLVGELTLDKLQSVVATEHEQAFVSLWIIVGKPPLPTPWIIAIPPGEDKDEHEGKSGDTAT